MAKRPKTPTRSPRTRGPRQSATPQRCLLDPDVHDQLLAWSEDGLGGAPIHRGLKKAFPDRFPHENTVYAELRRHRTDRDDAWTLADADYSPSEAGTILGELAVVFDQSEGQRRHFSKREAWWVARLLAIHNSGAEGFTPLGPGEAFRMAQLHVQAEQLGEQLSPWLDIIEPPLARVSVAARHRARYASKEKPR